MTAYGWAWVVVAGAVAVGLFALHRVTRGVRLRRTKIVLGVLLAVWLLLPAPVPGFEGHYAPAFLVFTFEALFQQAGNPRTAGMILAAGTALALALLIVVALVRRRRD